MKNSISTHTVEHKVVVLRRPSAELSSFKKTNAKLIADSNDKIGPSIRAVNEITRRADMVKLMFPYIIGIDYNNQEFSKEVARYMNSIAVNVSGNGLQLEIGVVYDLDNAERKEYINELTDVDGKAVNFKSSKELAEFVEKTKPQELRWMYGVPINYGDFLLWVYCLRYKDVANHPSQISSSPDIRFYIEDDKVIQESADNASRITIDAKTILFKNAENVDLLVDAAYVLGLGSKIRTYTQPHEVIRELDNYTGGNPEGLDKRLVEFKAVMTNKEKTTKEAVIQKLITLGVFVKRAHSTVIGETITNTNIGNSLEDATAWLFSDANKAKLNEYKLLINEKLPIIRKAKLTPVPSDTENNVKA